ncbi:hypothetical protein [Demequina gelatinilytica]|uniref:hypothetical protein n=1 Tax=Demequina gelatinilytica TaxID=1638980 RepID=UPI000AD3D68C|nr:hypothetical protein [Demequina gelatinilytica]
MRTIVHNRVGHHRADPSGPTDRPEPVATTAAAAFESPERNATYGPRRNQMEGYNRARKDSTAAAIAAADHRRHRGPGKQDVPPIFKAVGANIHAILEILRDIADREEPTPNPGGRPVIAPLANHRREPNNLPIRITGRPPGGQVGQTPEARAAGQTGQGRVAALPTRSTTSRRYVRRRGPANLAGKRLRAVRSLVKSDRTALI